MMISHFVTFDIPPYLLFVWHFYESMGPSGGCPFHAFQQFSFLHKSTLYNLAVILRHISTVFHRTWDSPANAVWNGSLSRQARFIRTLRLPFEASKRGSCMSEAFKHVPRFSVRSKYLDQNALHQNFHVQALLDRPACLAILER